MNYKKLLGISLIGVTLFVGCGQPQPKEIKCQYEGVNAPNWICSDNTKEGYITGTGSAKPNPIGFNFQKTEATAAARDSLSRQIKISVKNMIKQFEATTGVGKDQTADKATQIVSKQISSNFLNNSKILSIWTSPKDELFVLVGIKQSDLNLTKQTKNAYKTSLHNDNALWQKFLAENADKKLDEEVSKMNKE